MKTTTTTTTTTATATTTITAGNFFNYVFIGYYSSGPEIPLNSSYNFSVNCNWSFWGRWSACSKSCGRGYQIRRRNIIKYAKNGGKKCVGGKLAKRLCNRGRCSTGTNGYFVFTTLWLHLVW